MIQSQDPNDRDIFTNGFERVIERIDELEDRLSTRINEVGDRLNTGMNQRFDFQDAKLDLILKVIAELGNS